MAFLRHLRRTGRLARIGAASCMVVAVHSLTACPLPVAGTEVLSSPVYGRLVSDDGRPLTGAEIAVVTDWRSTACERTAVGTHTDAAGIFELPPTERHYEVVWIIPNFDRALPSFQLCAGVGDSLRPAYTGYGSLYGPAAVDTVTCLAWDWEGSPRVTCSGRAKQAIVTGGHWTDADGIGGFYRLLLTEELTQVRGYDADRLQERPHVYVQWVRQAPGDTGVHQVRATVTLPFDRAKVPWIERMTIWRREGRWMASLHGRKREFMNDFARGELVFELGAPGEAALVAGP